MKATFLMVESTCFVVKSPFLHRQTHLFCGNPGPTFARRSLGSGMVDRDCRLASPGDMDPRLRESGGFLRCFFCEERASLTIEKKQNMFLSWEMFILPWKIMILPWENGAFAMENICFDHGKLWFDHGKRCFDHGRLWFWHGKSLILRWEIVLLFYHDLTMGNNVFSTGKGEFTTKHGCVVGCNSDVIGRQ